MARNSLPSPLESALANAPTFGLPESFKQESKPQQTFEPGNVPFQPYFSAASTKYGVPVNVLMALAQQESSFNPTAVGQPTKYGRAKGLMQYIPSTAQAMGINPYDPVQSIDAAAKQLKTRLDKGYSMQEAISAHFGGDDRKQWGPKTRAYGIEVLGKAQRFFDGTGGNIAQPQGQQPITEGLPTSQAVTSPDLSALKERGTQIDTMLAQLNQDEPDRYRALTQEEVAQLQQQQPNQQPAQQQQQQLTADTPEMPTLDYSDANATQAEAKGIADKALDAVKDAGTLLTSGVNTAAKDVQELVGKIPYIGQPIVKAADRFDRWANGKGSEEIFKEWDKDTEKSLSPEMLQARKKAWVIEPGDDQGDGTKATSYSFGPAWSDPRAYASGILESLPEMAITMGGSGRLASMGYKRALAKGATREAAAKTAARTAMFAGGILEGGLGGAQASRETREQILKMSPEQLKDSEALASLMDSGRSFDEARKELADSASSKAFVLAGVTTGMFGGMGDRALAKIILGKSGRLKSALTGALGEGLFEEVPQSATQQMSQNYAMQDADSSTPLMRGVANQAAGGLAVGGIMGAGMGAAAPRAGQGPAADIPPAQEAAQVDPQQAAMEEAVAAAPTPSRDDTGLSDDAGPLERAARGTAQQPDAANGNFWAGEPGATIQMQAKGDPQSALVATVERYESDGGVTVRGEDGTPYTVSPDEVDITAAAAPQVTTDQQMQDAGTPEEVKAERAQVEEQQTQERQSAIEQALQEQGVDPNTGEILDSSPAQPAVKEEAPAQKSLEQMDEGELRDRMRYLARQAKTNGGWDKRLSDERRKVERVLDAQVQAAKAPVVEEQPAQQADTVLGADGKPKWFSTAEKAAAHIEKKGLTGYAPQEVQPGRFELRASTAEVPKPAAPKKAASNPRVNRVKKLVGEVGQTVSPSGEVGGLQPGARYTVDRIEKNGTTYLTNQETGETATVSMPDLEVGKSRRVEWSKVGAQPVAETATAEHAAQQGENKAGSKSPIKTDDPLADYWANSAGESVRNTPAKVIDLSGKPANQGGWREQATGALELVPDDHPMKKKWTANVKNGLKSESDRAGVMQAIVAAQSEPASTPEELNQTSVLPAQSVSGETVTAPVQAEASQQAEYGANNKLVSQDRAAELRQKLKAKFAQLNSGIDPEILAIGTELAVFHIEASARKFSDFAKAMAADLDMPLARLRPYLRSWYNGARDMMEDSNVSIDGMDSPEAVRAELAKLNKQPVEQPTPMVSTTERPSDELGPRPTSGLDAMVAEFDAEVERNGTATELGESSSPALAGAPAKPVRAAAEVREAGRSPAAGSAADGQGDGRTGAAGNDRARSLGDDTGELPVSARGAESAGRARAERGRPASRDGDAAGRSVLPAAGVISQDRPADLFTINAEEIGQGGDKTKYANNVAAIRVLKDLEETGRAVTAADQAALSKYVGWGGIPAAFERTDGTANKGWEKQVAELKSLLTPEEYAAAAASTRNAHYTSPEIVNGMWKALGRLGFTGGRVIEPSVGVGNFFGLMPQDARGSSALHGVELDRITSGIATALYPDAKIARMGYQEYAIPDGYFDVAVGNPPFGSEKLYDGNRKDLSGFSIHNYFFARSVDALRPGGVLAMVVTNRFLDGNSDKARQYIAERADLVAAIRLPNSAFAKNAGTEVTTDIIILQRRAPGQKPSGTSWMNSVDFTDKNGATVPLNEYFMANPDNMLGEFGAFGTMYRAGDSALVAREGQNTLQLLDAAINRLPAGIMQAAVTVKPETRETVQAENTRVGAMFISGDGRVMVRGEDVMGERTGEAVEFRSAKAEERVKGMLRLRDNLSRLRQLQLSNTASEAALEEARVRLNKTYDGFVKSNGPINSQANKLLFRDDPTWPQISALEDSYDRGVSAAVAKTTGEEARPQSAVKAAIFTKRTQQPYSAPTSANTAKDALVATLAERGRVDMDMMVQLYGKPEEQIAEELGDLLFSDPDAGWQTRDHYLSGNVKRKLARAEEAAKTSQAYGRNVEALRAVQPKDIEAVDINVKPGATWIPADTMSAFADHLTEKAGNKAFYNPLNANWSFPKLEATSSATARFGTSRMSVGQIIEAAAAQKAVQVYDESRDGTRTLNETETQLANDKVKAVKEEWDRWIWSDDARRSSLSRLYNDLFNTDVRREYDGSHLTFPGKISDDIIRLRPHQGNAVWRIVQGGSTLADHVVGAGKTFTLVAAAMELRRLGLSRKPMFVVPNHLVGEWSKDFIKLYPGANVLAATKRDFEKANRKRFFARIATGDWDAVIVAHSSFGKVGMKPETEAEFIREEIADLTSSIDAIEAAEGKKSRNVKQAAERRTKMEEKLKALLDTGNKDDSLYWDDLGIDALFLDEAHEFKNLAYSTGMRNVAGLGSSSGSQKSTDLYMKTRVVRKATGGRNVVFATGTPISNTMAEMYTMQRYLDYDNLKQSGLSHFDAWARMFGEVVTDWELSPSGQYKLNSRFAKFVNMPELMQRYTAFADVINRDDINRMLASQGKRLPVPKVKGGKPQNVVVERSQWQASYIGEPVKDAEGNDTDEFPSGSLVHRAENLPKKAEKGGDNMLKIMSDARKAALDMRLIDPDYPDNPDSKVNFAANNIKEDYDRWHDDKGAQLVFIDLSTPKGARADEAAHLRDLIERAESNDPAVADPAQAELDKMSPDDIDALKSAFSVYDDLKQKLVERGIPAEEIAFIHDAKTDLQKTDLFAKVRTGRVRVLFGSTAKMGAGMNVQERLVALHHLDAPWRPSDLEQREGRIIRQGNKLYDRDPEGFEVGIYRYATKQTLDSRMWQTIEGKATFIEQVRKGDTSTREIEDVAGEAANAAEMKAASSGNPLILEEMSLRQRIRTLENERTAHDRDQFRIRDRIGMEQGNVKIINRQLVSLRADDKLAQPAKFEVTIDGQTFDKRKDAGEAILQQTLQMEQTGEEMRQIGTYGGFKLTLEKLYAETYALEVSGTGTYSTKVEVGADPAGLSVRLTNSVRDLPAAIEKMEDALTKAQEAIPALQAQVKPWQKEEQLKEATARHGEVIEQLRPKKKTDEQAVAKPATDEAEPQLNDLTISTIEVDGKSRPTTNSNGKPIHPTEEGIRNFWRWFGDSKVVDERGRPLVVYHGTYKEFDAFDRKPAHRGQDGLDSIGSWFTSSKERAADYGEKVMPAYVRMITPNPYETFTELRLDWKESQPSRGAAAKAHKANPHWGDSSAYLDNMAGIDGLIIKQHGDKEWRDQTGYVVFDAVNIKSATGNSGSFDHYKPNIFNDLAMDTQYSRLPEGNRIQLAARLRKLEQQKEQLTPEQYSDQLGELASWLEERSRENAFQRATAERQRGADMVLERLHRARRRGEISEQAADIAIWALNRNPQLAEDLGFSISSKGGSSYDRAERIAKLMTEGMRDTAPIHEILHHTERMMPPGVQKGIAAEYNKAWANAYKKATPEQRAALDALRLSAFGNKAARDATMKAFESGLLDYDQHYQLTNASEYWAVNAASIMAARHGQQGWAARAKEWIRGFIQKARSVFGLPSTAAVIKGLDAVTKGDGSFLSTRMLATNPLADTPVRDLSGDYADMPTSPSGMDPAPEIPTDEQDRSRLRQWWDKAKNAPSDLTTDAMQKGLALIPFRPLVQEMARNLPAASEYLRLKQSMDAMRNRWHAKTDEVAQKWLEYRKDNKDENVEMMNLMHEATLLQVDPSEDHESIVTNRDREALRFASPGSDKEKELLKKISEDKQQQKAWENLNTRYERLSPQARQIFKEVRDAYTSLADGYEKVLLANMEKAINVRIKKAEREHRYELQRIEDEGLTGEERTEAMDDADHKLRVAKTKTAWNRKARMTQLRQQFELNRLQGPYFPLARFGNLFVTVRDAQTGKVESFSKFEKASEQREFADLMRKDKNYKVQVGTLDDTGSLRKAVDPNFVADVEDILADLPNAESVKDEVWQRYLESLPDFSVRKGRIHRTGRAGFNADALRAFGNQMFHGSHQLARLAHSFDMEEALDATREEANTSKDSVRDGLVVNEMEKRHQFIMNPTGGPLVQKITQAAFIYALAASPKAAIVNLTQTVIMGIPILAGYDGGANGVTRAANQLTRALGDFTMGKGKTENSKRLTADERKAMAEAYDIGIIDRTQSHDLAGIGETGVEYSPARTKIMALLAWGFHHTERLNREVTFLAAYRMARAKGLPHVGAVQKAGDLTWKTHFDYQNTSRPRIMHSDTMKALLVFRNFSINMLYRLFRDIHQATQGDTPEVRKEAKIQLAGITGMMMLSAGITGTWGFGIMLMIASAFMDDDKDPEVELKKNMVEALGPMMAGIVLDGVPGYATGTSLTDSIGMRDLWFRSPSSQLEGKDEADYWKAQLLGAAPSIADNIVRGYGLLKEGQVYRGIETMMPKAIKDPMKAFRYSTEGATNKRGDVIVEDIDTLDIIRQALGFVPAKIAEQYDINNAGYNLQQTIVRKRQALMDSWWKAEEAGDEAKLDSLEADIDAYNDKYPEQEITPKTLRRSAKTREDNAENATGGMRYNRKLRDRILEEQAPTIYR